MGVSTGFFGTKLYINEALPEIIDYRRRSFYSSNDISLYITFDYDILINFKNFYYSMPETDLALSQPVTQIPGSTTLSLEDDLLQCCHMTIADLVEATEVYILFLNPFITIFQTFSHKECLG